jgi:hypothetical protein
MRAENLDFHNCQYLVTESTRSGQFGPPKRCGQINRWENHLEPSGDRGLRGKVVGRVDGLQGATDIPGKIPLSMLSGGRLRLVCR